MYTDLAPKLAKLLVEYSVEVQEGDVVYVTSSVEAAPMLQALYGAILDAGGHPLFNVGLPGLGEIFFDKASDAQLDFMDPRFPVIVEEADVYMVVKADTNTKAGTGIDPQKMARTQQAMQKPVERWFERMGDGLRYGMCQWPTNAIAQEAEMGLLAYTKFVYEACALDRDDPVAYWREFHDMQERLINWLAGKKRAEIKGPGIDLSFSFEERVWVNCDGKKNMPDGEIFTGPVEDSVNGYVEFSYPSVYMGREVRGVKLIFKDGVVVEASAEKNEDHLFAQLDVDEGSRRLGEFAIGTNFGVKDYTGNTLFDEKIGGTIHMALGRSIPESLGENQSTVHWDIVHGMQDGGEIWIDGELFYRGGEFMVE